jgi:hypothetical protein
VSAARSLIATSRRKAMIVAAKFAPLKPGREFKLTVLKERVDRTRTRCLNR